MYTPYCHGFHNLLFLSYQDYMVDERQLSWSPPNFLILSTSMANWPCQHRLQVLLNDRDPVRWYESVKNTILQVVGWINGPATRYNQGASFQKMTIPVTRFNPIMQLLLKLSGQGAISVVPAVCCWQWTHLPIPELILQATCYAPTPLGTEIPRGLFGAVESGQEEAVRFFQAWKAQVASGEPWIVQMISNVH